jgi:hypothetical protein
MKPPARAAKKQVVLCPFRTKVDNVAEEHDDTSQAWICEPFETTGTFLPPPQPHEQSVGLPGRNSLQWDIKRSSVG